MWNRQVLRSILEKNQAASPSRTPNEQKIGDFYASCMNQASSGTNELSQIQPLLERIGAMRDKQRDRRSVGRHPQFIWPRVGGRRQPDHVALFGYGPTADFNDVGRVVAGLDQGGLGIAKPRLLPENR